MIANAMASAKDCDLDLPLLGVHRSRDRCVQLGRLQRERRKEHSTKENPKETAAQEWRCAELECGSFQHGRSNKMFGTHGNTTGRLTLWDPSQHLSMAWYSDFTKSSTQLQALRHRQIGTLPCPPYKGLPFKRRFVQVEVNTTGSLCRSIAAGRGPQCNDSLASRSLELVGRNRSAGSYRALVTTCLNDSCSCTAGSGLSGCEGHLVWNMHIYIRILIWCKSWWHWSVKQWSFIIHPCSQWYDFMQLVLYRYPSQLRVGWLEQLRWPSLIFMPDISNYLAGSWATKHESHRKPTVSSRDHLQVHSQKPYCWSLSSNILNQVAPPPKMEPWKIVVGLGYVWMSRLPGIDWCRQREASATKLVSLACTRLGDLELQSCSNECQVLLPERQVVWAWAVLLKVIVGYQSDELCKMCTFTFSWLHASSSFWERCKHLLLD